MQTFLELLKRCAENHTFDSGDPDCKTVLDQLYRTHAESYENDPSGIREGFKELENFLEVLHWMTTMRHATSAAGFAYPAYTRLIFSSIFAYPIRVIPNMAEYMFDILHRYSPIKILKQLINPPIQMN